jgi:hypothetical protein
MKLAGNGDRKMSVGLAEYQKTRSKKAAYPFGPKT